MYIAITDENFKNIIKPEMRKEYESNKHISFPSTSDEFYKKIEMKWRKYPINKKQYEKRTMFI